jgi:hypothetical protein
MTAFLGDEPPIALTNGNPVTINRVSNLTPRGRKLLEPPST